MSVARGLSQHLGGPLVQAGAGRLGGDQGRAVQFGRHAQHELAAGGLLGRLADLLAGFEIVVHRFLECGAQLAHVVGMEAHHVADAEQAAGEDAIGVIEFDTGGVAIVGHGVHGLTPIRVRNSRASVTW